MPFFLNPSPVSRSKISPEVITTKGCISTNKLPVGRFCNSSSCSLKGTKSFVLSTVNVPSLSGIIFINPKNTIPVNQDKFHFLRFGPDPDSYPDFRDCFLRFLSQHHLPVSI